MMKLLVLWFYIFHLAFVSAGLLTRHDLQTPRNTLTGNRARTLQNTGCCLNQGRHRPLFARRGQYERQRIHMSKAKEVPVPPKDLLPSFKGETKPVKPNCSPLTQSCFPQTGCCDPVAQCHCRFFNTICFCRRTNSLSRHKT